MRRDRQLGEGGNDLRLRLSSLRGGPLLRPPRLTLASIDALATCVSLENLSARLQNYFPYSSKQKRRNGNFSTILLERKRERKKFFLEKNSGYYYLLIDERRNLRLGINGERSGRGETNSRIVLTNGGNLAKIFIAKVVYTVACTPRVNHHSVDATPHKKCMAMHLLPPRRSLTYHLPRVQRRARVKG